MVAFINNFWSDYINMNNKIKIFLLISIILVCLGISAKMIVESRAYSCDKCEIHFKSVRFGSNQYQFLNYYITDLFDRYKSGYCAVSWDYNQGYSGMEIER